MTPSRLQFFYANHWPLRIWFALIPALFALALGSRLPFAWTWTASSAGMVLLLWLLGWLVALITGWFVLGPLYYGRGHLNGAPYQVGDEVQLLTGRHRGRVVRVLEVRESRDQVRVDLGEPVTPGMKDVYSTFQVCRTQG